MYMRIKCGICNKAWEVYHRDNWKADTARTCPRCGAEVNKSTWEYDILPAFNMANDAELEICKERTGAAFSISYMPDVEPENASKWHMCPVLESNMLDYDIPYQF